MEEKVIKIKNLLGDNKLIALGIKNCNDKKAWQNVKKEQWKIRENTRKQKVPKGKPKMY